jgi:glucose/arabinose dehydrogenase
LQSIGQFDQPLALATRNGEIYVAEKGGRVRRHNGGAWNVALDISGDVSGGSEQGLLGLTFAPDAAHAYINYTDRAGDTHVVEYTVAGSGDLDAGTRRELLFVNQPYANHNGGNLIFGRDGKLYVGLGDGGSAGDPQRNAQNLGVLLGKMLRIDPTPSGGKGYTIPADNPFVGRSDTRGEIWAYGLRNPWRYSFDRANGDLWIGDVGQNSREEVDHVGGGSTGGENYGWSIFEGNGRYRNDPAPAGVVPPVYDYPTNSGACAVTGGYVYRGAAIPALGGFYVFGDFCRGRVVVLRPSSPGTAINTTLQVASLASFGEDAAGELYVLSLQGDVSKVVAG